MNLYKRRKLRVCKCSAVIGMLEASHSYLKDIEKTQGTTVGHTTLKKSKFCLFGPGASVMQGEVREVGIKVLEGGREVQEEKNNFVDKLEY